ncbi:MAG: prolipoprotein diacylglyceryl transferase [Tissierellia bacterium]|nr:prolipoprotein diacylglyceryl transferase [Tissierellia bacterium]
MNPVAFKIFGIEIMWYGILIAIGAMIAVFLGGKQAKNIENFSEDDFYTFAIYAIIVGILGARLYYVIFHNPEFYLSNPKEILNIRGGGLAIHGGIIGGIIVCYIYSRVKKVKFFDIFDIVSPGLVLAQGIGRWGNFINQEAHGGPTDLPWGIIVDGVKVHPTFLYESIGDIIIFLIIYFYVRKHKKFSGQMAATYLILYSLIRFFVEGLRTDSLMLGSFRVAQIVSVIGIITGCLIMIYGNKKNKTQ